MTKSGKIILIGTAHPFRGGLANYNERLIREYRNLGYEAQIYTFSLQYPSLLFPGKTQKSTERAPEGLPIHVKVNSINPFNWIRVGRELRKLRPDLILVKFWIPFMAPCFGTICRIARRNKHTRIVTIIDNIIPHEKRPGDRVLAKYWIGAVDGCVAMSRSVLNDLYSFDPHKPKVFCPHPLYDNFGDAISKADAIKWLNLDPGYRYILFFGFIRDYKGLDLLLLAMCHPQIREMKIKLIVAGEYYCDPQLYLEIIEKERLSEKVILKTDFIPDSQVLNYFCAADVVVQPYKSATQSGVTQIAYHFDKPMIITDVGGLAEIVPDGLVGYVVNPDPDSIARAILRFYDEEKEAEFSNHAAQAKKNYSWSRLVEAIATLTGENNNPITLRNFRYAPDNPES